MIGLLQHHEVPKGSILDPLLCIIDENYMAHSLIVNEYDET